MAQRRRRSQPLKRRTGSRPERRTIVVFSEGRKSEPNYINGLKRLPHIARNTAVQIELDPQYGVPLVLVESALVRLQDPEVDECWCIFDVEWPTNHPNLSEALSLAQDNGIKLAISNPCFEMWLILHHQDFSKFTETSAADRMSRKLDGREGKGIDAGLYMPLRKDAVRRARTLAARHERDGTAFPDNNPSSSMSEFLSALEPD